MCVCKTIGTALLFMLLAGCAGVVTQPAVKTSAQNILSKSAYHDAIDLRGRLSVRYQQNDKEEAMHGSFAWAQMAQHTMITLSSPFGQTLATIDMMPGVSTLLQSGQAPRVAVDVDTLVVDTLGWPLPISGLHQWLQGLATDAQGRPFIATPQADELVTTIDGWKIHYVSWEVDGSASLRPKRIDLERTTAQVGDVALRIVIDNWQPH